MIELPRAIVRVTRHVSAEVPSTGRHANLTLSRALRMHLLVLLFVLALIVQEPGRR